MTFKIIPVGTKLSTLANTAKGVQVTWKKSASATGYILYRNDEKIKTVGNNTTVTFTDTGAKTNGSKYVYKVVAYGIVKNIKIASTKSKSVAIYRVARPAITSLKNTRYGEEHGSAKWVSASC